jgi:hypothetical protein
MLQQQHFCFSCKVTSGGKGPIERSEIIPVHTANENTKASDYQGLSYYKITRLCNRFVNAKTPDFRQGSCSMSGCF